MAGNTNSNLYDNVSKGQRSFSIEDILSLETFTGYNSIAVSPDGQWLAATVCSHRRRRYGGEEFLPSGFPVCLEGSEIRIVEVESGRHRNLTPSWGISWGPSWSPDGKQLAFYSDKDGTARLWIWERGTDQLRTACDAIIWPCLPEDASSRWAPDGARIIVKLRSDSASVKRGQEATASEGGATVRLFHSTPSTSGEAKPIMQGRFYRFVADIGVVTIATGEVHRLPREFPPLGLVVSPDGTTVAVADLLGFETKKGQELYDLCLLPLDGRKPQRLAERIRFQGGFGPLLSWSPDGRYLAYATHGPLAKGELFIISTPDGHRQNLTEGTNVNLGNKREPPLWSSDGRYLFCVAGGHLWQVSVPDGSMQKLTAVLGRRVIRTVHRPEESTVWSPDDGKSIYVQTVHSKTKQCGFYRIDIETGENVQLAEENRVYNRRLNLDVAPDTKHIFYVAEDPKHPADVWGADASFRSRYQITKVNPHIDRTCFGEARLVDWRTPQGKDLQGALILPVGYVQGEWYPLIVWIYGGARLSSKFHYFGLGSAPVENTYFLTSHGYAVFLPDAPMETNEPIRELTDAVLSGVDMAIDIGIADAERLGVMGHSYGGYSVNAIITQTSRFRAAVSSASISNLISFYGFLTEEGGSPWIRWAEMGQGRMGGTPWEYRERYIENSPIFYLDRVVTPLLLIYGALDAWSAEQVGEMFSGLRRLGKEVVLARYDGEEHWPGTWRYPNAVDFWRRVLAWFDQHLKF